MTQRVREALFQEIEEGKVKIASKRIEISDAETEHIYIKAPESTDKKAEIMGIVNPTGGDLEVDYSTDFVVESAGSDMNLFNNKTSVSDTSDIDFKYGGSFSDVTVSLEDFLPGGKGGSSPGSDDTTPTRIVVSNGDELLIQLTNVSSTPATTAVQLLFAEKDVEEEIV